MVTFRKNLNAVTGEKRSSRVERSDVIHLIDSIWQRFEQRELLCWKVHRYHLRKPRSCRGLGLVLLLYGGDHSEVMVA